MSKIGFSCYETIEIISPNHASITLTLKYGSLDEVKAHILQFVQKYPKSLPILEDIIRRDHPHYMKIYNQIVLIS